MSIDAGCSVLIEGSGWWLDLRPPLAALDRHRDDRCPVSIEGSGWSAQHPTHLAWSPDDASIAYATDAGVESVNAAATGSNPPTQLSASPAVPALLPGVRDTVNRIEGDDFVALSIAASRAAFPTKPGPNYSGAYSATVATVEKASAAARSSGPLLLTAGDTLDARVKEELQRSLGPQTEYPSTVQILGVSSGVADELRALGYEVMPLPNRGPASIEADPCEEGALHAGPAVVVANAADPVAIAVAASLAIQLNSPALPVDGELTQEQISFLRHTSARFGRAYVVGALPAGAAEAIAELLGGALGYETVVNPAPAPTRIAAG